jgi:hypothetical protein
MYELKLLKVEVAVGEPERIAAGDHRVAILKFDEAYVAVPT